MSLPVVMMVAEKPSICNSIASSLAGGLEHCRSRGKTPPVHEFEGTFLGHRCLYRVTSVTGHVFSTDFPKEYQDWESTAPADLFDAPIQSIPTRGSIVSILKNEGRGVDSLVLWLDCDREGENICFEVMRCVKPVMAQRHGQQIYRAKFSAVNREDIVRAMKSLGVPNKLESDAVDARQELDLKVGVAFSRFQTLFFQGALMLLLFFCSFFCVFCVLLFFCSFFFLFHSFLLTLSAFESMCFFYFYFLIYTYIIRTIR